MMQRERERERENKKKREERWDVPCRFWRPG
jgi:hypothetical protein